MTTDITIVLDRSGSMTRIEEETIGGYNAFLKSQQLVPGEANLSLLQFDTELDWLERGTPIAQAKPLTHDTFVPRGFTRLLDAIGVGMTETGKRLAIKPVDKVLFVIITDGAENSSKEFDRLQINAMILHQQQKYNWEFVFLAANQDAIAVGTAMGVKAGNSMSFAANSAGATSSFQSLAKNATKYRSAGGQNASFDDDDYKAQAAAGVPVPPKQ